jgi:hypothetical protein
MLGLRPSQAFLCVPDRRWERGTYPISTPQIVAIRIGVPNPSGNAPPSASRKTTVSPMYIICQRINQNIPGIFNEVAVKALALAVVQNLQGWHVVARPEVLRRAWVLHALRCA